MYYNTTCDPYDPDALAPVVEVQSTEEPTATEETTQAASTEERTSCWSRSVEQGKVLGTRKEDSDIFNQQVADETVDTSNVIYSLKTCSRNGALTGLQATHINKEGTITRLNEFGDLSSGCETFVLTEDEFINSFTFEYGINGVTQVSFITNEGRYKTVGDNSGTYSKTYRFNDLAQLVGFGGTYTTKINSLRLVAFDFTCDPYNPSGGDGEEPSIQERVKAENTATETTTEKDTQTLATEESGSETTVTPTQDLDDTDTSAKETTFPWWVVVVIIVAIIIILIIVKVACCKGDDE